MYRRVYVYIYIPVVSTISLKLAIILALRGVVVLFVLRFELACRTIAACACQHLFITLLYMVMLC